MKSILFILLILIGCYENQTDTSNNFADINIGTMDDYSFKDSNIPEYQTAREYTAYIYSTIERDFYEGKDYWKLPEETIIDGHGDCEDLNILLMYLLETRLGIDTYLILVVGDDYSHVFIKANNVYYDAFYNMKNFDPKEVFHGGNIIWEAPYNEVIWMTYYYHNNVGEYF